MLCLTIMQPRVAQVRLSVLDESHFALLIESLDTSGLESIKAVASALLAAGSFNDGLLIG